MSTLRIIQISDLHFSERVARGSTKHCHSVELLVSASDKIHELDPDYLIVSGDISNNGDRDSLLRALDWLTKDFNIGDGKTTGLNWPTNKLGVIPGNHDAWNSGSAGKMRLRWQRSLDNYNHVFVDHRISDNGCYYDWLERNDLCVFLAYVDSSYLGDLEPGHDQNRNAFGKVARGRISRAQFEHLLTWQDAGLNGKLEYPNDAAGRCLDKRQFAQSLKILVIHHYLFSPGGQSETYFMALDHRDIVVRNLVMAGFNLVLCGHKHIPDSTQKDAGELLDRRGRKRYLLNTLRRQVGLSSIPLQYPNKKGKLLSRSVGFIAGLLQRTEVDASPEQIVDLLADAVEEPKKFTKTIEKALGQAIKDGGVVAERHELMDLQAHLLSKFSPAERKELTRVIRPVLRDAIDVLGRKPLVQVLAGSTTKAFHSDSPLRSFNLYEITKLDAGTRLDVTRYAWEPGQQHFVQRATRPFEFD